MGNSADAHLEKFQRYLDQLLLQANDISSNSEYITDLVEMLQHLVDTSLTRDYSALNFVHTLFTFYHLEFDIEEEIIETSTVILEKLKYYQKSDRNLYWSNILLSAYSLITGLNQFPKVQSQTLEKVEKQFQSMYRQYINTFAENHNFPTSLDFAFSKAISDMSHQAETALNTLESQLSDLLQVENRSIFELMIRTAGSDKASFSTEMASQSNQHELQTVASDLGGWMEEISKHCQTSDQLNSFTTLLNTCIGYLGHDKMLMLHFCTSLTGIMFQNYRQLDAKRSKLLIRLLRDIAGGKVSPKGNTAWTSHLNQILLLAIQPHVVLEESKHNDKYAKKVISQVDKDLGIKAMVIILGLTYPDVNRMIKKTVDSILDDLEERIDGIDQKLQLKTGTDRSGTFRQKINSKGDLRLEYHNFLQIIFALMDTYGNIGGHIIPERIGELILKLPPSFDRFHYYIKYVHERTKRSDKLPNKTLNTLLDMFSDYNHYVPISNAFDNIFLLFSIESSLIFSSLTLHILNNGLNSTIKAIIDTIFDLYKPDFVAKIKNPSIKKQLLQQEAELVHYGVYPNGANSPRETIIDRAIRESIQAIAKMAKYYKKRAFHENSDYLI